MAIFGYRGDPEYNDNHLVYRHVDGEDDIARINALQEEFTEGNGGTIQLPSPLYTGASTLTLKDGVHLIGCGAGSSFGGSIGYGTQIESTAQTVASLAGARFSSVRDLNLRGLTANTTVVHFRGTRESWLDNVWLTSEGSQGRGVFIEGGRGYGSYINKLMNTHMAGFEIGVEVYGTLTNGARRANHNTLLSCRTDSCDIGVLANECDFLKLHDHHAENNRDTGLKVIGNSIRISASQSYFENRRSGNADIDASGISTGGNGWVKLIASRHGALIDPLNKIEII